MPRKRSEKNKKSDGMPNETFVNKLAASAKKRIRVEFTEKDLSGASDALNFEDAAVIFGKAAEDKLMEDEDLTQFLKFDPSDAVRITGHLKVLFTHLSTTAGILHNIHTKEQKFKMKDAIQSKTDLEEKMQEKSNNDEAENVDNITESLYMQNIRNDMGKIGDDDWNAQQQFEKCVQFLQPLTDPEVSIYEYAELLKEACKYWYNQETWRDCAQRMARLDQDKKTFLQCWAYVMKGMIIMSKNTIQADNFKMKLMEGGVAPRNTEAINTVFTLQLDEHRYITRPGSIIRDILFTRLDANSDGFISQDELKWGLTDTCPDTSTFMKTCQKVMEVVDTDGDGQISVEEFCDAVVKPTFRDYLSKAWIKLNQ